MTLTIDTARYGLLQEIVDPDSYTRSVDRFREAGIVLPTFTQLDGRRAGRCYWTGGF